MSHKKLSFLRSICYISIKPILTCLKEKSLTLTEKNSHKTSRFSSERSVYRYFKWTIHISIFQVNDQYIDISSERSVYRYYSHRKMVMKMKESNVRYSHIFSPVHGGWLQFRENNKQCIDAFLQQRIFIGWIIT